MFYEGCTYKEIEAFRELENETFDFGEGPMKMKGTESVYYKMDLRTYEDLELDSYYRNLEINYNIENEELYLLAKEKGKLDYPTNKIKDKVRIKRKNKCKEKRHIRNLNKIHWSLVYDGPEFSKRCYRGGKSKWLKKESNKVVRRTKNLVKGSDYRKAFDFWWILY